MSSPIRAALFDFDGTLLPFGAAALPVSTVRALGRLRQNGVKVILATGRPPIHLPRMPMLRAVTLDGYVMMNGQYCFDETGVFRELALPAAGMQALVDWLHTPAGQQELVCFVERDFSYLNRPIGPGPGPVEADTPVLDPARALTHPTYQLNAYLPPEREANFLAHCPGCVAVRWCDTFADILPAGGGKPAGLAAMLDHLGLRREESIAFGDGGNDISMLEYAGVGVAMGNALPAVKAAANYVTDSVDADGVEKALQHFGLI